VRKKNILFLKKGCSSPPLISGGKGRGSDVRKGSNQKLRVLCGGEPPALSCGKKRLLHLSEKKKIIREDGRKGCAAHERGLGYTPLKERGGWFRPRTGGEEALSLPATQKMGRVSRRRKEKGKEDESAFSKKGFYVPIWGRRERRESRNRIMRSYQFLKHVNERRGEGVRGERRVGRKTGK